MLQFTRPKSNKMTLKPRHKAKYQAELAEEITGIAYPTLYKYMTRNNITLAETIKRHIVCPLCSE
jgi:hypothetical protein